MMRAASRIGCLIAITSLLAPAGCHSESQSPSPRGKVVLWNGTDFTAGLGMSLIRQWT